jgi:hypothetical protein
MWGRVSQSTLRYGSVEPRACRGLVTAQPLEFLQLIRLVRVIGSALDYRFPNDFCA